MRFSECFAPENIVADLTSTEKRDVIHDLVQQLCASGILAGDQAEGVERAVMRREELGSTGIGKGIAVPHAEHPGVKGVVGVLGCSTRGVQFDALDGQPVHLVFLLVSSPDSAEPHLAALRKVTVLVRDDDFCAFLQRAKNKEELVELLGEADERLGD